MQIGSLHIHWSQNKVNEHFFILYVEGDVLVKLEAVFTVNVNFCLSTLKAGCDLTTWHQVVL